MTLIIGDTDDPRSGEVEIPYFTIEDTPVFGIEKTHFYAVDLSNAEATLKVIEPVGNLWFSPVKNNGEFCTQAYVAYSFDAFSLLNELTNQGFVTFWRIVRNEELPN